MISHNPYFNRWFSAIEQRGTMQTHMCLVTILILIDGFLQYSIANLNLSGYRSHNPYFNRWFSAISKKLNVPNSWSMSQSLF